MKRDTVILIAVALGRLLMHVLTNGHYGFHRDELATLDDARSLAWGYVAYPPLTPLIARAALELCGASVAGLRFFGALAQCAAIVFTGLMASEMGGRRWAQVTAALAVAIAPVSILWGALFQYSGFDYLWWVLAAYCAARLITGGVLLTPSRRDLRSKWLWMGVAAPLLIVLPNVVWQVQHNLISLDFLRFLHARDVRIGRTDGFLIMQLFVPANPFTVPLWLAGLWFYFAAPSGRRYRLLGWMFVIPFLLFALAQGREYYTAGSYPLLFAAGAVWGERWIASRRWLAASALAFGAAFGVIVVPLGAVHSWWWNHVASQVDDFREEIGWPELVDTVAGIRDALPADERPGLGILAGNYGEAGAIDLYGPDRGLPNVISGVNSYWPRGYGDPPPQTLIVVGLSRAALDSYFETCEVAGHVSNRYGVQNEETQEHQDIFVCRGLRRPWPEFWKQFRTFG